MAKHEFIGFISEQDDPEYIAKNMLRSAKTWMTDKPYPECKLTKRVKATIILEECEDGNDAEGRDS